MTSPASAAVARILSPTGVKGAGFLVTDRHIVSCAHVVAAALAVPDTQTTPPESAVELDFPLVAPGSRLQTKVIKWYPVSDPSASSLYDDIVLLEPVGPLPSGASPPPLTSPPDVWGHSFRAFGFPRGFDPGQYATGVIRGERADKWVQIEDTKSAGYFVTTGYSGSPLWDETANAVVGMIVGSGRDPDKRTAYMIPMKVLAAACAPLLDSYLDATPLAGPRVLKVTNAPPAPANELLQDEAGREMWFMAWMDEWFRSAKIVVDVGESDGVSVGDYFDVLYKHEPVHSEGRTIGFVDESGGLIRAAQVQSRFSVCQLDSWAYKSFFAHVLPDRLAALGIADADEVDAGSFGDVFAPVVPGQVVALIPSEEKDARDEVEDLYSKSLDDDLPRDEAARTYREMVRRADRFLMKFPNGYFADSVFYHKGYAQFQLGEYEDAIDTYELYLRQYPFGSAEGARGYIQKAKQALRENASNL